MFEKDNIHIVCWGCGSYAERCVPYLLEFGFIIHGFIDKNYDRKSTFLEGKFECFSPELAYEKSKQSDALVILSMDYCNEIYMECLARGIDSSKIFFFSSKKSMMRYEDIYISEVYSQEGEEIFLKERFHKKENGFYVDVGAHHPYRFSNTQWAYNIGWRGINIEPNPDAIKLFQIFREKDINLNCGVWNVDSYLDFYRYKESALNTFSVKVHDIHYNSGIQPVEIVKVRVKPLKEILRIYGVSYIDFLNIDVEGAELQVLESINFSDVYIDCILLEQLYSFSVEDLLNSKEYIFLKKLGYDVTSIYHRTVIYEHTNGMRCIK